MKTLVGIAVIAACACLYAASIHASDTHVSGWIAGLGSGIFMALADRALREAGGE